MAAGSNISTSAPLGQRPPCQVAVLTGSEAAALLDSTGGGKRRSLAALVQRKRAQRTGDAGPVSGSEASALPDSTGGAKTSCGWSITEGGGFKAEVPQTPAAHTVGTAELLRKLKEDQKRRPDVKAIDPNAPPSGRRRLDPKAPKAPAVEVPRPVFPSRSTPGEGWRKEIATSILEHTKSGEARVSVASSHELDLEDVSKRLSAPTLSFTKNGDVWADEEQEDAVDDLEVAIPQDSEMRSLLQREVQGKISSAQVRNLVERGSRVAEAPPALCGC